MLLPLASHADSPSAPQIVLPVTYPHNDPIWNQYTLRVTNGRRDALRTHLGENGIASEIYYPQPLDQQECFADRPRSEPKPVVAHQIASECLSIPIATSVTREQQDLVIEQIGAFVST